MSYDTKCDELARAFLADEATKEPTEEDVTSLAQTIQDAIKDWFKDH